MAIDDYYGIGFDIGRRGEHRDPFEPPSSDGDDYNFRRGIEDGERRRRIADELEEEGY